MSAGGVGALWSYIYRTLCYAGVAAASLSKLMGTRISGRRLSQGIDGGGGLTKIGSEVWILSNLELKDLTGLEVSNPRA